MYTYVSHYMWMMIITKLFIQESKLDFWWATWILFFSSSLASMLTWKLLDLMENRFKNRNKEGAEEAPVPPDLGTTNEKIIL